jgi:hypothetical protein
MLHNIYNHQLQNVLMPSIEIQYLYIPVWFVSMTSIVGETIIISYWIV